MCAQEHQRDPEAAAPEVTSRAPVAGPLDRLRSRSVETISHELRTCLALVTGPLEVLDGLVLPAEADRQVSRALRNVDRSSDHLQRLVQAATWGGEPARVDVDLAALLHRLAAARNSTATMAAIEVVVRSPATITTDPTLLAWAIDVLLGEALEEGDASTLTVTLDRATDDHVAVTLSSDGDDDAATADREGSRTGCGAVARELLTLLGAHLSSGAVHPEDRLRVELPGVDTPPRTAVPEPRTSPSPRAEGTRVAETRTEPDQDAHHDAVPGRHLVLIVEDDGDMRGFLERTLATEHRVASAASAEEGLTAAQELHPDLIICDLVLPQGSGEELITHLGGQPALAQIPVIVLTGKTDQELRIRMLHGGADDYITKPFVVEELRARVANLLAHRLDVDDLRGKLGRAEQLVDQLQAALDSRVVIEQAKAFIAAQHGISVDEAFEALRKHARTNSIKLHDVAQRVVDRFQP